MDMIGKLVVVTTDASRRGVFFGELVSRDGDEVTLKEARNCVYWSEKTRGFLGLAAIGPQSGSRVSNAVPELTLNGVTSISVCSDKAIVAWRSEPWN